MEISSCTAIPTSCVPEKKGAHTFLNPGSVSLPKEGNIPTYAILEDGVFTIKGFDGTVVKQLTL